MRTVIGRVGHIFFCVLAVVAVFLIFIFSGTTSDEPYWWLPMFCALCAFFCCVVGAWVFYRFVEILATLFGIRSLCRLLDYRITRGHGEKACFVHKVYESCREDLRETFNTLCDLYEDTEAESYREWKERRDGH